MMSTGMRRGGFFRTVGKVILGVIAAAAFALVIGALAMVLWNWLMPMIFGLTTINFWQAFGIVLLAKLLFGFGGLGGHDKDMECKDGRSEFKKEFRKEWDKEWDKEMDKEARRDMRGRMRRHFHTKCYDNAFEDWWEKEGAASFETYAKQAKADDEEDE